MPARHAQAGAWLETDVHAHLVPSVDDGSRDLPESIAMARGLERLGVRRVHLTPHEFRFGPPRGASQLLDLVERARQGLARAGVGLEVVAGAEYLYGEALLEAVLDGSTLVAWQPPFPGPPEQAVLIELPLNEPTIGVEALAERLLARGLRPVLAHPERVVALQTDLPRARRWREAGWRMQLDLLSLVGGYGAGATSCARALVAADAYDCVGSDLHRASQLAPLERAHAEWRRLTQDVTNADPTEDAS